MSDKHSFPPITQEQVQEALRTISAENPARRSPTRSLSSLWIAVPAIAVGLLLKQMGLSQYALWAALAICTPGIILFLFQLRRMMREQRKP